jgi:hypothetical protein
MSSRKDRKLQKSKKREKAKRKANVVGRVDARREERARAERDALRPEDLDLSETDEVSPEEVALALELGQRALDCEDPEERARVVDEALGHDPYCPEAMLAMADLQPDDRERLDLIAIARHIAGRRLGEELFERERGNFWTLPETRTYMLATYQLSAAYWAEDDGERCVELAQELLSLNPNDDQGVRHQLTGCYLTLQSPEGARMVREAYPDDPLGLFPWALVLEQFQLKDEPAAALALATAREHCPKVERYLLAPDELPPCPPSWEPGTEDEAILIATVLGEAWEQTPGALRWLRE